MKTTVITCDHCGAKIPAGFDSLFWATFLGGDSSRPDVHACTSEHLGLAIAKAFGMPTDSTAAADLTGPKKPTKPLAEAREMCTVQAAKRGKDGTFTCCDKAGQYNGFGSDGPTLFECPKGCACHD